MSAIVDQRRPTSGNVQMSCQSGSWSKILGQPLESRRSLLPFNSYFQFRFGGRHFESVVNDVERHRHCHTLVGRGRKRGDSRWKYVSMSLETKVMSTSRKYTIFAGRVPLVFQVSPGTGKSYVHAECVKTTGMRHSKNRFLTVCLNSMLFFK